VRSLAFTGHRPDKLGGYAPDNPIALKVKAKVEKLVRKAYAANVRKFIFGMALGLDMYALEICIGLKKEFPDIILVAAVPFISQAQKWPFGSQERWLWLLSHCDEIYLVDEAPENPVQYREIVEGWSEADSESKWSAVTKLHARNRWMMDRANFVIAVWDGSSGGTANAVSYALKLGKRVVCYDPFTDKTVTLNG